MGDALPMPTRIVLDVGHAFRAYGFMIAGGGFTVLALLAKFFGSGVGQAWWQRSALRLPLVGPILLKYEVTRFARSLGTLLCNGVPIIAALRLRRIQSAMPYCAVILSR